MLEIEQKFAEANFADLERRLAALGVTEYVVRQEEDHYHNAPDRDFKTTGEAFRLRRVGQANFLTYKGPRRDPAVKIRPELEIALRDGDDAANEMLQLLRYLGYRPVAVVRKRRRIAHLKRKGYDLDICLDEIDELGRFAEVEILAPEEGLEAARAVLLETAAELGLSRVEQRSYLTMLLAKHEASEAGGQKL
jgi:adenylate cyclase, class 2